MIAPFAGDDASDTARGVGRIAIPAGDEMDVGMKDRLAGRLSAIHTDVETGNGGVYPLEPRFQKVQEPFGIPVLLGRHGKPVRCVTFGYDQVVARADRKAVFDGPDRSVFVYNPINNHGRAEAADGLCVHALISDYDAFISMGADEKMQAVECGAEMVSIVDNPAAAAVTSKARLTGRGAERSI